MKKQPDAIQRLLHKAFQGDKAALEKALALILKHEQDEEGGKSDDHFIVSAEDRQLMENFLTRQRKKHFDPPQARPVEPTSDNSR